MKQKNKKNQINPKMISDELEIKGSFIQRKDYSEHTKCKRSNLKDGTEFCDTHFLILRRELK